VLEEVEDLARLGQLVEPEVAGLGELLLDDLVAQVDALVADVDAGPGDELLDLLLALAAEGALEQVRHPHHRLPRVDQRPDEHDIGVRRAPRDGERLSARARVAGGARGQAEGQCTRREDAADPR
jgi:hypothetical protein